VAAGRLPAAGLCALVLAAGCGNPPVGGQGDGNPRFTVGALELHAVSGAAVQTAYGWALYLSDQPDTCEAIAFVPQAQWTLLELRVSPQAGGANQASVVAPRATPAAGEAVGALTRFAVADVVLAYDAGEGALAWSAAADGTVTVTSIDVGFAGAAGRVAAEGLLLQPCSP